MSQATYPPLNMHFVVEFNSKELYADNSFQSVQGLKARICENEGKKGTHAHFENIILKRAYQPNSKLVKWCMNAINNRKKQPVDLLIKLLNSDCEMLSGWRIERAVPVAWGVEELHAQETKILIETIELDYHHFHVLNSNGNDVAPMGIVMRKKT